MQRPGQPPGGVGGGVRRGPVSCRPRYENSGHLRLQARDRSCPFLLSVPWPMASSFFKKKYLFLFTWKNYKERGSDREIGRDLFICQLISQMIWTAGQAKDPTGHKKAAKDPFLPKGLGCSSILTSVTFSHAPLPFVPLVIKLLFLFSSAFPVIL